jgi:hypothetical protein
MRSRVDLAPMIAGRVVQGSVHGQWRVGQALENGRRNAAHDPRREFSLVLIEDRMEYLDVLAVVTLQLIECDAIGCPLELRTPGMLRIDP